MKKRTCPKIPQQLPSILWLNKKLTQESKFIISVLENPNYPHPSIINAVTQAMEQGHTLYPPIMGIPELRHMGCEWMYNPMIAHSKMSNAWL
ncbi:hypothetical protein PGH42_08215 [Legionella pneumophila]|nr:hypothetical protein PGH42_08215 [Legionella pneumophila]